MSRETLSAFIASSDANNHSLFTSLFSPSTISFQHFPSSVLLAQRSDIVRNFQKDSEKNEKFNTKVSLLGKKKPLAQKGLTKDRKSHNVATFCSSFLLFVSLLGNINFNHISLAESNIFQNKAFAIEATFSQHEGDMQLSSWPPDQLLPQILKSREIDASNSPKNSNRKYWDIIQNGNVDEVSRANERLIDHAVATINTMYYDSSGGFRFDPRAFYDQWKEFRYLVRHGHEENKDGEKLNVGFDYENSFTTRENAVKALKWLVSSLDDPYSKYLTREELKNELGGGDNGFLGLGAIVNVPPVFTPDVYRWSVKDGTSVYRHNSMSLTNKLTSRNRDGQWGRIPNEKIINSFSSSAIPAASRINLRSNDILTLNQAFNLPIVTAIVPDSPAERAGIVVGDRIASVGAYHFTGMSRSQVKKALEQKFHADNYFGQADLTIAKPIVAQSSWDIENNSQEKYVYINGWYFPRKTRHWESQNMDVNQVFAYKLSHLASIPTTLTAGSFKIDATTSSTGELFDNLHTPSSFRKTSADTRPISNREPKFPSLIGGDAIVHYAILTPNDSIFQKDSAHPVGYIRLTRFSKASTAGYIHAVNNLEAAGVDSYIIDLRNNYGGVIQEAMLTASTLLRDPHTVLCYTLNSRGGFRPQENVEYIIDDSYPGYFLSKEPRTTTLNQVRREHPEYFEDGWSAPTSYASLRELKITRGIKPAHFVGFKLASDDFSDTYMENSLVKDRIDKEKLLDVISQSSQKKLVLLINEGTASAAEVFASALHDNGRTLALIGSKTFGKGLIQHTFPMPDGGGLRITVAEYLTPSLQHVTKVGEARYDSGIKPDILCESKQGIPKHIGADICVGVALDVLESQAEGS